MQKVVICGAGFLGSNIAKVCLTTTGKDLPLRQVQVCSRFPQRVHNSIREQVPADAAHRLLPPVPVDITRPATLPPAFEKANVVISLVGIMNGTPADFERIQWKGAENVARAAQDAGAKLIHISAIGADPQSSTPYERTKALGEQAVFSTCPKATVLRPSIVFGPGDGFFGRFAQLSKYLPFMPVFSGGRSRFQPVYVGDIARAAEIISRDNAEIRRLVDGKIIEAGGPDVLTYREVIELVLKYSGRRRPIVSIPFAVGHMQGLIMEKLPPNLLTITRAQVEQLKKDNVVNPCLPDNHVSFKELLERYSGSGPTSVHDVLPTYL